MSSPNPPPLSDDDRSQLSARADQFFAALAEGGADDWEKFLTGLSEKARPAVLTELVLIDMGHRWERGERPTIEDYLKRFPELGPADRVPAKLIVEEHRCRMKAGEAADIDGYRERFPSQFKSILPELEKSAAASRVPSNGAPSAMPSGMNSGPGGEPGRGRSGAFLSVAQQYEFVRELGRGMFGEVWLAQKKPSGIERAVKILLTPSDRDAAKRELRSLEAIKNLRHPYLLATEDFWVANDRLHIVMEYADGGTLRTRFKECRKQMLPGIPDEELLGYISEAAEGLDYLHECKVTHRDVKPDNILLLHGHAKVADFGLARHQDAIMASMSFAGTPAYMAPEVWGGEGGPASDQYSLAFAYTELRQGKIPIPPRPTMQDMMLAHLDGLFEFDQVVGEAERAVLRKAMSRRPEDRYGSCGEFVEALAATFGKSFIRKSGKVPVPPPRLLPDEDPLSLGQGSKDTDSKIVGTFRSEAPRKQTYAEPKAKAAPPLKGGSGTVTDTPRSLRKPPPTPASKKLLAGLGIATLVAAFGAILYVLFFTGGNPDTVQTTEPESTGKSPDGSTGKGPDGSTGKGGGNPIVKNQIVIPTNAHKADGAELVALADGRQAYDWIEYSTPETVRFKLIAPVGSQDGVKPFYIMETKVWARLYLKGPPLPTREQPPGAGDEAPVVNVTASEAAQFAAKVYPNGWLPSPLQWDHAAGFHDRRNQAGPTSGGGVPRTGMAIPMPTRLPGEGADKNQFGLIDMGGNGTEWTGAILEPNGVLTGTVGPPTGPKDLVILRGRRYTLPGPLTYKQLEYERTQSPQTQYAETPTKWTSFRVVVPVP